MKLEETAMRRFSTALLAAGAVALAIGLTTAAEAADVERGKKVYRKCKTCHFLDKEKNKVGPHLVGIFGRTAGAADGFKYSDAMKESGIVWDEKTIDEYLVKPKEFIPGNKMAFAGLKKEKDRQDVIAYMKANSN